MRGLHRPPSGRVQVALAGLNDASPRLPFLPHPIQHALCPRIELSRASIVLKHVGSVRSWNRVGCAVFFVEDGGCVGIGVRVIGACDC